MAPVNECEPPTLDPQPIPVNNHALSPEVLSHKENQENQAQHRYNLQLRPKLANFAVSPVHRQPPRVHPSLSRTTIPPKVKRLRSRVAINNYDINPSLTPSIKVQSTRRERPIWDICILQLLLIHFRIWNIVHRTLNIYIFMVTGHKFDFLTKWSEKPSNATWLMI